MENVVEMISDIHNYSINVHSREIYLHSQMTHNDGEDPGVDYRMASTLIKNVSILDSLSNKSIVIRMVSIGGEVNSGMAIYDCISAARSHVTIISYAQAESMSGIILQAADSRVLSPNCYFMAHFGSTEYSGNYLDAQASAKMEKSMCNTMLDIYSEGLINSEFFKTSYPKNSTPEKARSYLLRKLKGGDWYLNPSDAIYYGFADSILGDQSVK